MTLASAMYLVFKYRQQSKIFIHVRDSFRGLSVKCKCARSEGQSVVPPPCGRMSGNKITSRMLERFMRIMQSRSMPIPRPPAGGIACLSARTKSSSILAIESSSAQAGELLAEKLLPATAGR